MIFKHTVDNLVKTVSNRHTYIYIYIAGPSGRSPAEIVGSNPTRGMDVCCECCVLSGRGLCDELITRPEESYRLWCIVMCDLETSKNEEAMTRIGLHCHKKIYIYIYIYIHIHRIFRYTMESSYLTLRQVMSYVYGAPILDVSRSHTTTQHSR